MINPTSTQGSPGATNRNRLWVLALAAGMLVVAGIAGFWFASQLDSYRQGLAGAGAAATSAAALATTDTPTPTDTPIELPTETSAPIVVLTPPAPAVQVPAAPATAAPTEAPTETAVPASPTPTETPVTPTDTPTVTLTPTLTVQPYPTATLKPTALPGMYVTRLWVEPASPKFGEDIKFTATFANNAGEDRQVRWFVKIFEQGSDTLVGQTAVQDVTIPPGPHEYTIGGWKPTAQSKCVKLYAQAFRMEEQGNKEVALLAETGEQVSTDLNVCP